MKSDTPGCGARLAFSIAARNAWLSVKSETSGRAGAANAARRMNMAVNRRSLGWWLCALGAAGAFYFFAVFEVSVEVPTTELLGRTVGGGRVTNIGLLAQRQNGLLLFAFLAIGGLLLALLSPAMTYEPPVVAVEAELEAAAPEVAGAGVRMPSNQRLIIKVVLGIVGAIALGGLAWYLFELASVLG